MTKLNFLTLTVYALACWRLSAMTRCSSIWLSIPIASYAYFRRYFVEFVTSGCDIFLVAMSRSAISILLNRIPKR